MTFDVPLVSGALGSWDWGITIAVISLTISAVLAIRELASRPIPLAHVEKVSRKTDGKWLYTGFRLTLANAGRMPMVVYGIGTAAADKTGTAGFQGSFDWHGSIMENPVLPCILRPGEALVYVLPAERYPEDCGLLRISLLKRRWFSRARAKVVAITLPEKVKPAN